MWHLDVVVQYIHFHDGRDRFTDIMQNNRAFASEFPLWVSILMAKYSDRVEMAGLTVRFFPLMVDSLGLSVGLPYRQRIVYLALVLLW